MLLGVSFLVLLRTKEKEEGLLETGIALILVWFSHRGSWQATAAEQ
jgi:hypothetical protein